jgi:Transcriptional regulators
MRLPQLTPLERKVVESITSRDDLSESTSLKEIAVENNVSEAMIVKLTKKLNFLGVPGIQDKFDSLQSFRSG